MGCCGIFLILHDQVQYVLGQIPGFIGKYLSVAVLLCQLLKEDPILKGIIVIALLLIFAS